MSGWRGRTGGLARPSIVAAAYALVAVCLAAVVSASAPAGARAYGWQLVARGTDGQVLLRVALPGSRFVLRYRNSVYGSVAEERFAIGPDGRMVLIELAADEAAVLDEYYVPADRPRRTDPGDTRLWKATAREALQLAELHVAATRVGERTLVVEGRAMALWQLPAAGGPTVILATERTR
jgi:hypothetical protein